MVTLQELIGKTPLEQIPESHQNNLNILLQRINIIRKEYNKSMSVTSGYRSEADHLRIYTEKAKKECKPFDKSKVPMGSQHLRGAAVDISDPNKELQSWCKENVKLLESAELWMEDFSATPNWCHFQIFAPKSGNRFFKP